MSLIWHEKPAFPATHLDDHVTRYRVSSAGAVALSSELDDALAELMTDKGASFTALESFRAEAEIVLPPEMFTMEVDGQGVVNADARSAAIAGFVEQLREAELEVWRERARQQLRAAEIPAGGEYIVDWNEAAGAPTLAWIEATLGRDTAGLRAAALREINAAFERSVARLTAGYPESEKLSWSDQKVEALAWQADNRAPTPYLDAIAAARGVAREVYLQKTLSKVQAFQAASASAIGERQRGEDLVKAAGDGSAITAARAATVKTLDALYGVRKS